MVTIKVISVKRETYRVENTLVGFITTSTNEGWWEEPFSLCVCSPLTLYELPIQLRYVTYKLGFLPRLNFAQTRMVPHSLGLFP